MAERKSTTRQSGSRRSSSPKSSSRQSSSPKASSRQASSRQSSRSASRNGKPSGTRVVARAREQLGDLIGRPIEGALGLRRTDEGWEVVVEVVELHRVPDTTDVLASYAVHLDADGELTEYHRVRRYYRNQADEER